MWINVGRPTQRATPQIPEEEVGVKKSSTAERPVERRSSLFTARDSIEAILNFKTHPNVEETKVTEEDNLVSRVLHDQEKLKMLYGKGTSTSKKLVIPDFESAMVFRRDRTSRNPIPRPQTDFSTAAGKRGLVLPGDTTNILRRKTLLYSEPSYRPSGGTSTGKEVHTDPRQLISILGDPLPYKRSDISYQESSSSKKKKARGSAKRWRNERRERRTKGTQRKERFMDSENSDGDMQDVDAFYNRDLDEELSRRDPGEHNMLEHLLDDYSPSFGTRDEKMEKESTIKQIEKLTQQSSALSKDYDFTGLPSEFANMEVSEGELPSYEKIGDTGLNIRRSKVSKNAHKRRGHKMEVVSSKRLRVKTGPDYNEAYSQPKVLRTKRSLPYHHRHHHHHTWRSPYLHIRSPEISPYSDYPYEQGQHNYEDFPNPSSIMRFHRLPVAQRWPKFPISLMAERFFRFPRLPKISEFSPEPLERLEHLPPPAPIPPAIINREKAGDREAEPVDELAPFPEPIPEPEPPPIPELPFIKEIPPIAEPQEPAPENLDPKKTFDTGESNGGVKKSSSR